MTPIYAFAFLVMVFALGDIIAEKTKAMVSTVLVVIVVLLISFWLGLPAEIIEISQISGIGMVLISVLIVGIGSNIDIRQLVSQWKTCIIALSGALAGVAVIMFIGQFIIGRHMAFVAGPVFSGTQVAILILIDALTINEMTHLIPFILLVFVTDNLLGIPVASFVLKKEAKIFIKNKEAVKEYAQKTSEDPKGTKRLIKMPESMRKPSGIFTRIVVIASLSFWLSGLTGGRIHFFVMCLIMGVIFTELGFLEKQSLIKTQSYGFVVFVTTVVIFGTLSDTTPQMFFSLLLPLLITLGLGFIGVLVASFFISKGLKVSPWMGIAMGVACSFGMPTTFLIPKEVAQAIGTTDEEKAAIENYMTPNMVTAGFVSVTIASVFIAQVAVLLLFN